MARRRRLAPAFKPEPKKSAGGFQPPTIEEMVKIGHNLYLDTKGEHWTVREGLMLRCFKSGNLKDQERDGHVVHFGAIFKKPDDSPECMAQVNAAIDAKMQAIFGNNRGKILKRYVDNPK